MFATCDAKVRRRDPAERERCATRLHILGTGHGLCLVAQISAEEYDYLVARPRDVLELYEYLGIVAARAWVRDRQQRP